MVQNNLELGDEHPASSMSWLPKKHVLKIYEKVLPY